MNSLLNLSGEARPGTEPAMVAAIAVGSVDDEATQLAQDFASALAALSAAEPGPSVPAAGSPSQASADPLPPDLRDLLRALEQGLPAAQPKIGLSAVAVPVESDPAEATDAAEMADMPAMAGQLLQLLQPQLTAQRPSAPVEASADAELASLDLPSIELPTTRLPTPAIPPRDPLSARSAVPVVQAATAMAVPTQAGDEAQRPAETRVEPGVVAALPHAAKAGSDGVEVAAAADGPAAGGIDGAGPATALGSPAAAAPVRTPGPVAPTVLQLPHAQPDQWQQPLMQALGDRLQLQIAARSEQAVIRLEPPLLGRVEIAIQHQAGDLQVRLSASHPEVTRQLQHVSEGLRQDLAQRQTGEVSVQVSQRALGEQGGQMDQSQGQRRQAEADAETRRPGRALGEDVEPQAPTFAQRLGAGA